ncbi:MAG: hypothetical protein CM1200mP30_04930 [Pseudomonadota bacterium]|nr:MAG: hypothetical protein CM1200mP30_04930 [Pseudomonadota bacterium]
MVLSGCIATLKSVHIIESETTKWGLWLYVAALTLLIWEVMGSGQKRRRPEQIIWNNLIYWYQFFLEECCFIYGKC